MRRSLLLIAVVVTLLGGGMAVAAQELDDANTYTGCLATGGAINKVAIGDAPVRPCSKPQVQISWSEGVPPADVAALADRVTDLEDRSGRLDLSVDCAGGDTVADALAQAQDHLGPVAISISGMCEENVGVTRDDVALSGVERGDGIRSAKSDDSAVRVQDSARVSFSHMTLVGGRAGIEAESGSSFLVENTTVRDSITWGILAQDGASATLRDCLVQDSAGFGVTASGGGSLLIDRCTINGNLDGVLAESAGSVRGFNVESAHNVRNGAVAQYGGSIVLVDSEISDNGDFGVHALWNGSASVSGSVLSDNGADGAQAGMGSVIDIRGSTVERNGNSGISASRSSTIAVDTSTIRANTFDGIALNDQSNGASSGPGIVIEDNGALGIRCAGPAGFPEVQNGFDLAEIAFSGNVQGDTNCP